jgi:anthranilate phosphoribosyltransferase
MSLHDAIEFAVRGEEVPSEVLEDAFGEIMDGEAAPAQVAGLLTALRTKGETVGEIVAAARALRERAVTVLCPVSGAIDTCGTGGDGANTFNISTTAAFVAAGAGVPVAKHGNRAASSRSGSADVLEALGVRIDLPVDEAADVLEDVGISFFFARLAHPAMRHVAPVREALGIRTLMNCLGPLLNPLGVQLQLVGVYADELVETLAAALGELGAQRALVVHGSDGLDELTTMGSSRVALLEDDAIHEFQVDPQAYDLPLPVAGALRGGDARENAKILREVLAGEVGARRDVVVLNAGAALWVAGLAEDLAGGLVLARKSLDSGAALERLERLVKATHA